jgi:hypothetical protein
MKNRLDDHFGGLCTTKTIGGLLAVENQCTTPQYHDETIVVTPAVKEYRESLLIILPEATSRSAEQGNISILPAENRIFPVPYRSSKMVLHVRYSKSYQMSAS